MFQVLIVDDEYLSQNKLSCIIDWEKYGFYIAASVDNGKDAVSFLNHNHVDVIFTDVCMPLMDGIELTEYVKANFPDIKVIVMSGFNDYEYVREAFRNNALDYILKHTIDEKSMEALLVNISEELAKNNVFDAESNNQLLKEKEQHENLINSILGKSNEPLDTGESVLIAAAKISNYSLLKQIYSDNEFHVLYQNIKNTLLQILNDLTNSFIFTDENDYFIIYMPFSLSDEIIIMQKLKNYIQQMNYSVKKFFDLRLLWGISCIATPFCSIGECYREAINMLENSPIKEHDDSPEKLEFSSLSVKNEKNFLFAISTMNTSNIDLALDKIFADIPDNNHAINIVTAELLAIANKICEEYRINIERIGSYLKDFHSITTQDASKDKFSEWCKTLFHHIIEICISQKSTHKTKYSGMVKEFIHDNYNNNISLKLIAAHIGINEAHLSTCFKEETGETITKYIINYRIEKAKELLEKENDIDIKYLYSAVGFNNYNHFFVTFKKIVGVTPTQYKQNYMRKA